MPNLAARLIGRQRIRTCALRSLRGSCIEPYLSSSEVLAMLALVRACRNSTVPVSRETGFSGLGSVPYGASETRR